MISKWYEKDATEFILECIQDGFGAYFEEYAASLGLSKESSFKEYMEVQRVLLDHLYQCFRKALIEMEIEEEWCNSDV